MTEGLRKFVTKPEAAVAAALLMQLGLLRALAAADMTRVWFVGHELQMGCWFRQHFGFPCPACGMTRSVIMTLHGNFASAWHLNPAGPLGVAGLILFSIALLWLIAAQQFQTNVHAIRLGEQRIKLWTIVYGGLLVAVLIIHWLQKIVTQ